MPSFTSKSPFGNGVYSISSDTTIYVAATGNDTTGDGSVTKPFLTIQRAIDSVKGFTLLANVTISVGAGTFDGFVLDVQGNYSNGVLYTFKISGSLTQLETGTFTSQSKTNTLLTLTDSTKSWTVNAYADKFLEASVSGVLQYYPIISNTSTSLVIATSSASFATLTYRIVDLATIVAGATGPFQIGTSLASTRCSVEVFNNAPFEQNTVIELISFTPASGGRTVNAASSASGVTLTSCKFSGNGSGNVIAVTGGLTMFRCLVDCVSANGVALVTTPRRTRSSSLSECFIKNSGSASGIILGNSDTHSVLNTYFFNCGSGILLQDGCKSVISGQFDSCGVAIFLRNRSFASNGTTGLTVHGSGNAVAIECDSGSMMKLAAASTITGTVELSVDGATSTIAAMRAASPKIFPASANPYGSYVFE